MSKLDIEIYTDGGCAPSNPGIGGWGAVLLCNTIKYRKDISGGYTWTTNNRMELTAAISALESLNPNKTDKVTIYADSQYVVNAFNKKWLVGWKKSNWKNGKLLNIDLWQKLSALVDQYSPTFVWVKAHDGNEMNECADALCEVGRDSELLDDSVYMQTCKDKEDPQLKMEGM